MIEATDILKPKDSETAPSAPPVESSALFASLLACDCCGGEPVPIRYNKGRFPVQQKRGHCRGCGALLPKGRSGWCCRKCYQRFEPQMVLIEVRKRDADVCSMCGYDSRAAREAWVKSCWAERIPPDSCAGQGRITWRKPEYDHIKPFSEGGLTILENMRTLCSVCHKQRTAEWHRSRKANK